MIFPDFSTPMIISKAFQGLEKFYIKFQDFSYFSRICTNPDLYSAIKSEDSEVLDGGTSQLSSQREYGEIKMFWGGF